MLTDQVLLEKPIHRLPSLIAFYEMQQITLLGPLYICPLQCWDLINSILTTGRACLLGLYQHSLI